MILRAIFWITLVSVLMPHEPDLGLGRPGTHGLSSDARSWASSAVSQPGQMCRGREAACAEGLSFLDSLQSVAVHSLAQVKADIEAQQRARSVHG
jgi:hypothetical protein